MQTQTSFGLARPRMGTNHANLLFTRSPAFSRTGRVVLEHPAEGEPVEWDGKSFERGFEVVAEEGERNGLEP